MLMLEGKIGGPRLNPGRFSWVRGSEERQGLGYIEEDPKRTYWRKPVSDLVE